MRPVPQGSSRRYPFSLHVRGVPQDLTGFNVELRVLLPGGGTYISPGQIDSEDPTIVWVVLEGAATEAVGRRYGCVHFTTPSNKPDSEPFVYEVFAHV